MTNEEIVNHIVHRIMYEHEECPEDTAMRLFIEQACNLHRNTSYTEKLLEVRLYDALETDFGRASI